MNNRSIDDILKKALSGNTLKKDEIVDILSLDNENDLNKLYNAAREIRNRNFMNKIFLYGFVYFSNYCRNNCNFCYSRKSNNIERYRKNTDEIIDISLRLKDSGVNLIDLTMGEDPFYHNSDFKDVFNASFEAKKQTNLPMMISPGVVDHDLIDRFSSSGIEWYALYQETHNRNLFELLRKDQDYDIRMNAKLHAKSSGMLIEEGILVGVGETLEDIADSILEMKKMEADQVRVMTYVSHEGIPLKGDVELNKDLEFKTIAVMRLLCQNSLIPASLDIEGIDGLKARLDAGANVITSIILPSEGLQGVAQSCKDIDDGNRSVESVNKILNEMNLKAATSSEYSSYVSSRKALYV